jgi:hypothetical protein
LQGDFVLLSENRYHKNMEKIQMHWLGPFIVEKIHESGAVKLVQLDGVLGHGWVNGTHRNPYMYAT